MIKRAIAISIWLISCTFSQATIKMPPNWPTEMPFGFVWGVYEDQTAVSDANISTVYPYRYVNTENDGEKKSVISSLRGTQDMFMNLPNLSGGSGAAFSFSFFKEQVYMSDHSTLLSIWNAYLTKMNDPKLIANWFENLDEIANVFSNHNTIAILEVELWATLLQARFHFSEETCKESYCSGKKWADILDFSIPLRQGIAAAGAAASEIAAEVNADVTQVKYPETVRGLARAMVKATKLELPNASIFIPTETWAVYTSGCHYTSIANLDYNKDNMDEILSTAAIVNWNEKDVVLAALINVQFFRDLFGWDWNSNNLPNDYNNGDFWPHGFTVEKHHSDAGMVWDPNSTNHYLAQWTSPGAGTQTFFWDQSQMDTWLSWAHTLAHGTHLPLLAYDIPLGNGSLPNKSFAWQDTFVDWLFGDGSSGSWSTPLPGKSELPQWDASNWNKFKQAGFIGLFAGRSGWPATGTHWGARITSQRGTGCGFNVNGVQINCTEPVTGDGGYFLKNWKAKDKSLSPTPVLFNESTLETMMSTLSSGCAVVHTQPKTSLPQNVFSFHDNILTTTIEVDLFSISGKRIGHYSPGTHKIDASPGSYFLRNEFGTQSIRVLD